MEPSTSQSPSQDAASERDSNSSPQRAWDNVKRFWAKQPRVLKAAIVTVAVLTVAAGAMLAVGSQADMRTLFSNLTTEDAAAIAEVLKGNKVPFQISEDGTRILVPADQVHQVRLDLAAEGLPKGGGVGFELFDNQQFGMTEFEERVAMRRALEGELARTISRIKAVKSAKVNLVLPKRSLLGSQATEARASVVLDLYRGRTLPQETIDAVTHLVSSSVEGLSPDKVTLVDTYGKLLSRPGHLADKQNTGMDYQQKFEQEMQQRIEAMLDRLLGPGRSVARVFADFDFAKREIHEEHYDPAKTAVRSERRELEVSGTQQNGAGGIPGTRSNLPGGEAPVGNSASTNSRKEMETKNWEIDKVVTKTIAPGAALKRISVSVLVDGKEGKKGSFVPRSPEEIKKIERAVQGAIGFDKRRGDLVTVQSIPFHRQKETPAEEPAAPFVWRQYLPIAVGVLVVLFAFLALLTFRPRKVREAAALPAATEGLQLPRPISEVEAMVAGEEGAEQALVPSQTGDEQLPAAQAAAALPGSQDHEVDLSQFDLPSGVDALAAKTAELLNHVRSVFEEDSETAARILSQWLNEGTTDRQEDATANEESA